MKRILRYLKGTLEMGLTLESNTDTQVRAYCDSDWGGCQDTRRSTGGFCPFLGSNLVSWSAKRQDSVASSSTEAEYRTLSDTSAELAWIGLMLKSVGVNHLDAAEIYCDNLSAVHLMANPVLHKKSKHFATHYHFAREKVADGSLIVYHIPAAQQLADIFTKSLPQHSFQDLRNKLGVDFPPTSSLRGSIKPNRSLHDHPSKTLGLLSAKSTSAPLAPTVTEDKSRTTKGAKRTEITPHTMQLSNRYEALMDQDC